MDAPDPGARPSTLVSEMKWAARLRGGAVKDLLMGCLSLSRLLLPRQRDS
jgi:hypothetical protein